MVWTPFSKAPPFNANPELHDFVLLFIGSNKIITRTIVNKIIYLSKILSNFMTPSEYTEEKVDNLGRKIIYNKYKVLDLIYTNNQNI